MNLLNPLTKAMDWNNMDMESPYERDQNILDNYTFSDLILEMECNAKELTLEALESQFNETLKLHVNSAKEVFEANKENILKFLKT